MHTLKVLSNVALIILIINVILYLIGFSRNGKAYKVFSMYLLSMSIIQIAVVVLAYKNKNNHFLSTYYLFLQFITLSFLFFQLFKNVNRTKRSIVAYVSSAVVCGLAIQYLIYPAQYYTFNSVGFFITSMLLIVYAVLYLYELLSQKLPFYYVTIGIFIYLISSALIFASAASLVTFTDVLSQYIWQVNAVLFILYQLLILWEWKKQVLPQIVRQH